ncbi:hypothetical protein PACTADRAFT_32552 [Pachysolen tannophilus NRRL Y-2460]|uniref:Uncharacterized protein n=1 Tax=Pachysolen tannophilus NRRL Y-2460 TaxID=669874 RepID=A0A1E4TZ88_PACTA|nr:hypothetical protein PACTADRAFT_32552 [Pachysolen tannophilus NRRL Y-2460]
MELELELLALSKKYDEKNHSGNQSSYSKSRYQQIKILFFESGYIKMPPLWKSFITVYDNFFMENERDFCILPSDLNEKELKIGFQLFQRICQLPIRLRDLKKNEKLSILQFNTQSSLLIEKSIKNYANWLLSMENSKDIFNYFQNCSYKAENFNNKKKIYYGSYLIITKLNSKFFLKTRTSKQKLEKERQKQLLKLEFLKKNQLSNGKIVLIAEIIGCNIQFWIFHNSLEKTISKDLTRIKSEIECIQLALRITMIIEFARQEMNSWLSTPFSN